MRCSKCGGYNREGRKFCTNCGTPLVATCPKCSTPVQPGEKFCGECGVAIGAFASRAPSGRQPTFTQSVDAISTTDAIDGERKTVTALFADIKGSTELMEDLDPEEARAIIDPALKLMIEAVGHLDGYMVQSTGDGIFALFGAPVAHEDHPQRALYAALRLQDAIRRYSAKLVADGCTPLEARVGINTGEVVMRTLTTADGHAEYTPIGHTANLASRMQAIAPTGSIAITEHTRRLVEGYFQLKSRGPTRVKGLTEPINLYEVMGLGPLRTRIERAASRGLTKFVGRQREMGALKHAAEQARTGQGQIVAVMADPGVGKSRLFYEFKAVEGGAHRASMAGRDACPTNWMVLEALSISHGKASAYLPVIDLLRNYFEISSADDERKRREKVAGKIAVLDRSLEDTLPYLFSLLGIVEGDDPLVQTDGQLKKRRTLEAIKRILLRESLNQPLMVMFEDLHWMDAESEALLSLLAGAIATSRILLLVNYRPEYSHHWGSKTYYTQLRLDPLGTESADEMLSTLLTSPAPAALSARASRERASPERAASPARGEVEGSAIDTHVDGRMRVQDDLASLKRLILEKTEGNPLFMEEIVLSLFEEGALAWDNPRPGPLADTLSWRAEPPPPPAKEAGEGSKEGSYREGEGSKGRELRIGEVKLTKPLASLRIPPTVQGILASRIDRLPRDEKDLLQTVAVIGTAFNLGVARAVSGNSDDELNRMLNGLQMAEFIYEHPAAVDIEYTFKHALTHDVAYNSLLAERRKLLHERTARAIEALYPERLDDRLNELAYHYDRSDNGPKTVEYLGRSGAKAARQVAHSEAIDYFTRALELLPRLPESVARDRQELDLQFALSWSFYVARGRRAPERESALLRAQELCERLGDNAKLMEALLALAQFLGGRDWGLSRKLAERVLAMAKEAEAPAMLAGAHVALGVVRFATGQFREAYEHFERADELFGPSHDYVRSASGSGHLFLGIIILVAVLTIVGYPLTALGRAQEVLADARRRADPYSVAQVLFADCMRRLILRDTRMVAERANEILSLAIEHEIPFYLTVATFFRGWAIAAVERRGRLRGDAPKYIGSHSCRSNIDSPDGRHPG
jgi:class 3 adenylate cyclase/tetratricopeptide (TPR) repeat protein